MCFPHEGNANSHCRIWGHTTMVLDRYCKITCAMCNVKKVIVSYSTLYYIIYFIISVFSILNGGGGGGTLKHTCTHVHTC